MGWRFFNSNGMLLTHETVGADQLTDLSDVSAAAQTANFVLAAGDGTSGGDYRGRALVEADIPSLAASKIGSGQLALERGGAEADLSATGPGVIQQRTAGAAFTNLKYNFSAAGAPTANDDGSAGYDEGSWWFDLTNDKAYVCLDASTGAAVWTELGSGGASALDDLTDVVITAPAQGDILTRDGSDWDNVNIGTNEVVYRGAAGNVDGLAMAASTIVARLAAGDIVAATVAQIKTLLALAFGDISGTLGIGAGGTGQTTQTAAFDALAPTTTKGDLIVHNGTDNIRVAVGATNGHVLTVDSAEAAGVKWAAGGAASVNQAANVMFAAVFG